MQTPLSIKTRIFRKIEANLSPLVKDGGLRKIQRKGSALATTDILPSLLIIEGQEDPIAKDDRGRTFVFPVLMKLTLADARDVPETKDELVCQIEDIMEDPANLQLGGLVVLVDSAGETPFVQDPNEATGGALLVFTVEYRRLRGNSRQEY